MVPEPALPPVIPDYELLKPIGRGSYGEVWLARSVTGVFRVIKVVRRSRFEDDRPYRRELEGISRFQAAVSGRPRQLALLHVGRNDDAGFFYYVMEPADDAETGSAIDPERYVPLTLRELFKRRGRLPARECVELGLELARGLAVLHGESLIHRDIKPSNIIFVQRVPKLADVGLVASTDATLTGVGTPGYIPREGPGTVAADIYSLGKVLYELATGLDRMEFPRIPPELADIPDATLLREINAIILKACHQNPSERHPSAEHFARDLELIQAGRSFVFYEDWRRRTRWILAATATVAVLAGLASALFVWRSQVLSRANEKTQKALYRSDMSVAKLAIATGDLERARAALDRQLPRAGQLDLRDIEWAIFNHAVQGEGTPLQSAPESAPIRKITVDPNGKWVAALFGDERDDKIGVWKTGDKRLLRVSAPAAVLGGFLYNSQLVIDEPERALRYEDPVSGPFARWNTGRRLRQLLPDGRALVVSPSGDLVFQVLRPPNGEVDAEINLTHALPETRVSTYEATPDGKYFLFAGFREIGAIRERMLVAFDLSTKGIHWKLQPPGRIVWIRCSPDTKLAAINIGGTTPLIVDLSNPQNQVSLEGHAARVQDAAFSPSSRLIATASADQTVRIWECATGRLVSSHSGLGRPCTAVAWLPSEREFVAGDDVGSLRLFSFPSQSPPNVLSGLFNDVHGDLTFSPDGQLAAVTKSTNELIIVETSNLREHLALTNLFQPICFLPNGRELVAFGNDWTIWRSDLLTGQRTAVGKPLPNNFSVDGWSISPSGKRLAMTGLGGSLAVIDIESATTFFGSDLGSDRLWGVTFQADSQEIWTGSVNGAIKRWRASDAASLGEVTRVDGDIQTLALSPDGRWLAVALFNDSSLRVCDRQNSRWLRTSNVHRRFIQALHFTQNSARLVSAGVDGRVVMWRVPEFEEIATLEVEPVKRPQGDEGIAVLRLTPDSSIMGALTEDGRLQVWRTKAK